MNRFTSLAAGVLLAALATSSASAADPMKIIVAADSSSGTYHEMLSQIIGACNDGEFTIVEADGTNGTPKVTGGAVGNLAALKDNKVSAAFMHSDVIFYNAQANPDYNAFRTLVALYPEDIHIVALRNSGLKAGGTFGFGAKAVEFETLSDLKGYKVGAAGGGVITGRILTGQGEGGFEVVAFDSGSQVLPALDRGEIQAAIFVGGAPLPNIVGLDKDKYKLLPVGEKIADRLSGVYRPTIINYANLASDNVKTLAPMATLVTRKYSVPKFIAPQAKFRTCFNQRLTELQETPGNHPKWQVVIPNDHGVWQWYDLPGDPPAASAEQKK